jgi:8-oxo-dGTP diphosphatase
VQAMMHFNQIHWDSWESQVRATLLFVRHQGRILLIRKKRGLGAGKVNGPGGKIESGETALESAIREVHEEVGLRAESPREVAHLRFQFVDGLRLEAWVYFSEHWSGEPVETEEAIPFWCDEAQIPYGEMWADDALWLPLALQGKYVELWALFDGDVMLGHGLDDRRVWA